MPYKNTHRTARISPTKVRPVADQIRGKSYEDAESTLMLSNRRAAVLLLSCLRAAAANASEIDEVRPRDLVVKSVTVDSGPTIKRFQPKDRGRAHAILKRTSHIAVTVDEKK